jgi:hypothetical protein
MGETDAETGKASDADARKRGVGRSMNFGQKALQVLKTVAPTLATAVGGPFGALAATVISAALGTPAGDSKAAETALLSATPDTLLALRKAEQDFTIRMRELGIEEDKLVYDDIANARAREIAVKDNTPRNLAYLVLGFAGACILATLAGWTKVDSALAGTLIGYLVAESRSALSYYFGSSQGSKSKDQALEDIAKQP